MQSTECQEGDSGYGSDSETHDPLVGKQDTFQQLKNTFLKQRNRYNTKMVFSC